MDDAHGHTTKHEDAPVVVVAPDSRIIVVVVVVVVRDGSYPRSHMLFQQCFNHNRGARLISNEPRPRTFYLGGSYEVLHGVLCGLARRRSPRPDEFTTRDQAIKAWWSWS